MGEKSSWLDYPNQLELLSCFEVAEAIERLEASRDWDAFLGEPIERLLLAHVCRLNDLLCELANMGRWAACEELWSRR